MQIRPATATDWSALSAIDSFAAQNAPRALQIEHWIAEDECHLLEQNDQTKAYAVLTRHFFDRPFIEMIMVGAAFRRQGHASAMIEHLASLAPGCEIWTSTNRSNVDMQRLLARHGFVQRGLINLDEDDPEPTFAARLNH